MKLTVDRREEVTAEMFKKTTAYTLEVQLDATSDERLLIEKHGWSERTLCQVGVRQIKSSFLLGGLAGHYVKKKLNERSRVVSVQDALGALVTLPFDTIEELADAEVQVVENARALKRLLDGAAGFLTQGPQEVEL